jgi:2Fe-2S ferredoxin
MLAPIDATQDAMLSMTASERKPSSRLSCQIVMSPALDGISVDLPEHQV